MTHEDDERRRQKQQYDEDNECGMRRSKEGEGVKKEKQLCSRCLVLSESFIVRKVVVVLMTLRWICDVVVAAVSCYRHQEVYVYNLINSIAAAEAAAMAVVLVVL